MNCTLENTKQGWDVSLLSDLDCDTALLFFCKPRENVVAFDVKTVEISTPAQIQMKY